MSTVNADEGAASVYLARRAFRAAINGDWEKAATIVNEINDELLAEGVELMFRTWCDMFIDHATDGDMRPHVADLTFIEHDSGATTPEDELPSRASWAGRMLTARAAMDHDGWFSVLKELPEDPEEAGSYVATLLGSVTLTVKNTPRGFANPAARAKWLTNVEGP